MDDTINDNSEQNSHQRLTTIREYGAHTKMFLVHKFLPLDPVNLVG